MAISRFKTSTLAQGLPKYQDVWDGTTALFDSDYELIERVTAGSGGLSSISFTSVPTTYRHLQVRGLVKTNRVGTSGDWINLQFNSDTGSNYYTQHRLAGNGASASSGADGTGTRIEVSRFPNASNTDIFGVLVLDILDYLSTNKHKTVKYLSGYDVNGTANTDNLYLASGLWSPSTIAAISTITFTPGGGTAFPQYSSFALYGIKGAS